MSTRYDVSKVPLQGGYVAKQCPVRAQNDAIVPFVPIPTPPILERRFEQGRQFEKAIFTALLRLSPDSVLVERDDSGSLETATVTAMEQHVGLILGGRLPADSIGRRVGKPDLLVAAGNGGYRAVDVKNHMSLEPSLPERNGIPGLCSEFQQPFLERATIDDAYAARKRESDLLQLAHYQRMLEAAGLAAPDGRLAGIIGVEQRIVWYDLDAPVWTTKSTSQSRRLRSTMERYDFEFEFRLDVLAVAEMHEADPSVELLVVPIRIGECDECPWWEYCMPLLEAGSGDVSLLPRVGFREWQIHREHGVLDRAGLGGLDVQTARLVAAGVDVAGMMALIEDLPDETPIADLGVVVRSKSQLAKLEKEGVNTFGALSKLSRTTASYSGSGLSSLPDQIDLARAALGEEPIYRRRGIKDLVVPRADVEVDVDMENVEAGVYLWGALVTDRSSGSPESGYHPFVCWDSLTPQAEADNSARFWRWLTALRSNTSDAGQSFRAYCYNASAENTYLRKLGLSSGILPEVTEFIDSEEWVDMLVVIDTQLITGRGSGLKRIAPIAGFAWEVDDPGGGESMLYHDTATGLGDAADCDAARRWLLTYNEGDVQATFVLRNWLDGAARDIPSIESLDPHPYT